MLDGAGGTAFRSADSARLLYGFTRLPPEQRASVIAAIHKAFDATAADGITAEHQRRYARAQVDLFGLTPDKAIDEIDAINATGLIDHEAINNLMEKVQPVLFAKPWPRGREPEKILIPHEPQRIRNRLRLAQQNDGYTVGNNRIVPANWTIAIPEIRLRLLNVGERLGASAVFLPGGNEVVIAGASGSSTTILLVHAANARSGPIELGSAGQVLRIIAAREARSVAVLTSSGELFVVHNLQLGAANRASTVRMKLNGWASASGVERPDLDDLVFAIAPSGKLLAVGKLARKQLEIFETENGTPFSPPIGLDDDISGLFFANDGLALATLRSGTLTKIEVGPNDPEYSGQMIAQLDAAPISVALISASTDHTALLAGMPDGRILLLANTADKSSSLLAQTELMRLPEPAKTIVLCTPDADYTAVTVQSENEQFDAGRCVTIQTSDNSLDLYGLPIDSAGPVLSTEEAALFSPMSLLGRRIRPSLDGSSIVSISSNGRKVASKRSGRLEIRPLVYDPPALRTQFSANASISVAAQ
jgi:hypothetical protein